MLENLLEDPRFRRLFPPVAATGLIIVLASLGLWQLDRAAEKNRLQALFESEAPYTRLEDSAAATDFQNIEALGTYDGDRQVLVENMFVGGRVGNFVLTPFRPAEGQRLLIVNRGWVARPLAGEPDADLAVAPTERRLRGQFGHLPRVGMRSGAAFPQAGEWPKKARYPTLADLSSELGEEIWPFVLLLSPTDEDGFVRHWQPAGSGPMMHYGYAFQWFAMAAAVLALLIWHLRKRRR